MEYPTEYLLEFPIEYHMEYLVVEYLTEDRLCNIPTVYLKDNPLQYLFGYPLECRTGQDTL